MARPEHLTILKKDIDIWNNWRNKHPGIKPDLSYEDFQSTNFQGANFTECNLRNTNFAGCDFQGTNFTKADLTNAILEKSISGLQNIWRTRFRAFLFALVIISGFLSAFAGAITGTYLTIENPIHLLGSLTILIAFTIFSWISIRKNLQSALAIIALPVTVILVLSGIFALVYGSDSPTLALTASVAITISILGIVTVISVLSILLAIAVENLREPKFVMSILGLGIVIADVFFPGIAVKLTGSISNAGGYLAISSSALGAIPIVLLSTKITHQIINKDDKDTWLKTITIAIYTKFGTNFQNANLTNADFTETILESADLRNTIINKTNWHGAKKINLARVDGTILRDSTVRRLVTEPEKANITYLVDTDALKGKNLSGGKLSQANLSQLNLHEADFYKADLSNADLHQAKLFRTNFIRANLANACFTEARLNGADLIFTDLRGADLRKADLQRVQALSANFEGANFTGACIKDWNINSETNLKNVTCEYIYLEENQKERRPANGNFDSGDFERLVQKTIKTVDLIFKNGIDWKSFLKSFQELQNIQQIKGNGNQISIRAIETRDDGSLVIRINTPNLSDIDKKEIEQFFYVEYKKILTSKEKEYKQQLKAKDEKIDFYLKEYRQKNAEFNEITKTLANKPMTYFDQRGQKVNYQYNAAGNINLSNVKNEVDLRQQLEALQSELNEAIKADLLSEEQATDAEYKLKKVVLESKKIQPDKNQLIKYLKETKDILIGVGAAGGIVQAIIKVIEIVKNIF